MSLLLLTVFVGCLPQPHFGRRLPGRVAFATRQVLFSRPTAGHASLATSRPLIGPFTPVPPGDAVSPPEVARCSSVPCRPHTPWYDGVNECAFVSIVQTRPGPIFGRPVHRRGRPHRLRPGTAPQALRIPPCDGHPALRSARWLQVRLSCVRLSPSCPGRRRHTVRSLRPARHYPRLWIWRSSFERQRDFNPPEPRAAQHTLSASLTAARSSGLPRLAGLSDLTSHRLNRTALPCSHGTLRLHASGTNPGSIPGHSPCRSLGFCLPHRAIGSATSTTIDFGVIFPFTNVPAYNLPVYASQCCRSHHARLGTRLRATLCRGRHCRRLNSMSFQGATLTDPSVQDYRTRFFMQGSPDSPKGDKCAGGATDGGPTGARSRARAASFRGSAD